MFHFELLEWRDRRYQHVKFFNATRFEVKRVLERLNKGYTGPRFAVKEVTR